MSKASYCWFFAGILGLAAIVVSAPGCGGNKNKKVTITGAVFYKGQRLSSGMLRFVGPKGVAPSAAPIQKDGTFIMTDVTPGDVQASILATPQSSGPSDGKTNPGPKIKPAELPEKYQDPETSGLKYTITPGTTKLDIKID
jgi:hypothetical protein